GAEVRALAKLLTPEAFEARLGKHAIDNLRRVIGVDLRQPLSLRLQVRPAFLRGWVEIVEDDQPAWLQDARKFNRVASDGPQFQRDDRTSHKHQFYPARVFEWQ